MFNFDIKLISSASDHSLLISRRNHETGLFSIKRAYDCYSCIRLKDYTEDETRRYIENYLLSGYSLSKLET